MDGYQADRSVVTGALQVVGQQLVHRALLQLPLQGLLPRALESVQTHLHEAELEVRQPPPQRAADVLQLRRACRQSRHGRSRQGSASTQSAPTGARVPTYGYPRR